MSTLICPVCHYRATVKKEHHQKMPPHDDHKGRPCRGTGREPLLEAERMGADTLRAAGGLHRPRAEEG